MQLAANGVGGSLSAMCVDNHLFFLFSSGQNVSEHGVQRPPNATYRVSLNYTCTAIKA